ncbi:MAG TPA: hypothetical protein VGN57_02375 [Pirellulaceae bacterium]|jgi:quercetin dioxygenase-like cupin family protein|nr:hypothetical protein [Pirellulaceae bacterium]
MHPVDQFFEHAHPDNRQALQDVSRSVQREGGPVEEVRPDDGVWFPPDERRWYGASPAMTHIADQEERAGKPVDRMEHDFVAHIAGVFSILRQQL